MSSLFTGWSHSPASEVILMEVVTPSQHLITNYFNGLILRGNCP